MVMVSSLFVDFCALLWRRLPRLFQKMVGIRGDRRTGMATAKFFRSACQIAGS